MYTSRCQALFSLPRTILIASMLMFAGCMGDDVEPFACLGYAVTAPWPRVGITVTDTEGGAAENLCTADVLIVENDGTMHRAKSGVSKDTCHFRGGPVVVGEDSGIHFVKIHLDGYQSKVVSNLERIADQCGIIETTVTLEPSTLSCAEGYADHQGACETRFGCPYPQFEEQYPPAQAPFDVYVARCVDECMLGTSSRPGICRPISAID